MKLLLEACTETVAPELLTVLEVLVDPNVDIEVACNPLTRLTPVSENVVWPGAFVLCGERDRERKRERERGSEYPQIRENPRAHVLVYRASRQS